MEEKKTGKTIDVGIKSFLTAIVVIFIMMISTYGLTFVIPGGYIPFWKWLLSPVLVLFGKDNESLIAIIVLLLLLGGIFNCLDKYGILQNLLDKLTKHFGKNRTRLLVVIPLFFMLLGSVAGTYEECVPLVPVVVALAVRLGWDALTGLGMSLLAAGCGFAAGVCNPFTVGVAQEVVGIPMFSGIWFRIVGFIMIYLLLIAFLFFYAKKMEKPVAPLCFEESKDLKKRKRYHYYLDSRVKNVIKTFGSGVVGVLPGVILILMANSIRFTLMEGNILEVILEGAVSVAKGLPGWSVILFIYGFVLVLNFFIPSGSAKAFLLMPILVPIAENLGISAQLCIMAFAFGDGFSNVFFPTNPVLLISLGLVNVSYGTWIKWSVKFQVLNLMLTGLLLLLGLYIGYC